MPAPAPGLGALLPNGGAPATPFSRDNNGALSDSLPLACLPANYMLTNHSLSASYASELREKPTCQSATTTSRASLTHLNTELYRLQGPIGCSSAPKATAELWESSGWGAILHGLVKPLMYTFSTGKVLTTPRSLSWTGEACATRGIGCIMQSFAPDCEGDMEPPPLEALAASATPAEFDHASEILRVVPTVNYNTIVNWEAQEEGKGKPKKNMLVGRNMSYLVNGDSIIPAAYRPQGWFWYTVHLNSFIWRPGNTLKAQLDAALESTGLKAALAAGQVLGLHVRQGDSCGGDASRTGRECTDLDTYMVEVEKLRAATGVSTIYLATDSKTTIESAATKYPQYTWLRWLDAIEYTTELFTQHPNNVWDGIIDINKAANKTELNEKAARLTSVDMMLLAQCDHFVGKFTSNFFRTAYELKTAECDCAPPFVSLDAPWCFDYAAEAGTSTVTLKNGTTMEKTFLC